MSITPVWLDWWFTHETRVKCPDCGDPSPWVSSVGAAQQWVEGHIGNCPERDRPVLPVTGETDTLTVTPPSDGNWEVSEGER